MNPYDIECIVLGTVLRYGKEATGALLPELRPDAFIFSESGGFGIDHQIIWEVISSLYDQKKPITFIDVATALDSESHRPYLISLLDRLEKQYHIDQLNIDSLVDKAATVRDSGMLYHFSKQAKESGRIADSVDVFIEQRATIKDVQRFIASRMTDMKGVVSDAAQGYQHVSTCIESLWERWERQFKGEQTVLLPVGMPTLLTYQLFPRGKLVVVHGLSNSGKSAFVHQVNVGTAIGLVATGAPGCVAINSLEMSKEDLLALAISRLAHIDVSRFNGGKEPITKEEMFKLRDWADFAARLPLYIDETNLLTTSALQYRATGLHASDKGPVVQLSSDYTELFRDEEDNEEQRISSIVREHFSLSRATGASVMVISQSTVDKNSSNRTYIAGPDGTRHSRSVLHACDIMIELFNPIEMEKAGRRFVLPDELNNQQAYLFVQKYRNGGNKGFIPLGWVAENTLFFDLGIDQEIGNETVYTHVEQAKAKLLSEWS